jgi:hypothetical protein
MPASLFIIQNHGVLDERKSGTFINPWRPSIMPSTPFPTRGEPAMPSLHLDVPSIDWIERPPRADRTGGGKASPVPQAPAPRREHAKPPARRDAPDRDPWPGRPAGFPA